MRQRSQADRRKDPPGGDEVQVLAVSARFEISEHEVFLLAYRHWFGREPEKGALAPIFDAYLWRRVTPLWVRSFARDALALDFGDGPALRRLGLERSDAPAAPPRHGRLIVAATAAVFLVLYAGLFDTSYDPRTSAPVRLTCQGGGPGLVALERFAYAFSGRVPPDCPASAPSGLRP